MLRAVESRGVILPPAQGLFPEATTRGCMPRARLPRARGLFVRTVLRLHRSVSWRTGECRKTLSKAPPVCGIGGILGSGPVARPDRRCAEATGYDSARVAILENGKLARRRAKGKLRNLEGKLAAERLQGSIDIRHIR